MGFRYTEANREEYFTDGLTVLRDLIPPTLLGELRREADKARVIARQQKGGQTQRLQPVYAHEELDPRPFREFLDLPELRATVDGILGNGYNTSDRMAIFLEPEAHAWSTAWHRDWGDVPGVEWSDFARVRDDLRLMNQFNAALYDDHSLWVVPGSHNRENTSAESAVVPDVYNGHPKLADGLSEAERERAHLNFTRSMPGAHQVMLNAGDMAFYRACSWHLGNYVPYVKRATLHDSFPCQGDLDWQHKVRAIQAQRRGM